MDFQSTIYIKDELLVKLMDAVDRLDINRSSIIEALLIKYLESNIGGNRYWKMLKYQKLKNGTKARRISVCWDRGVYERSIKCKQLYRKSVSLILAEAIELYLDEIIDELGKDKETYKYRNSSLIYQKNNPDHSVYITIWGSPGPEILKKLQKF